MARLDEFLPVYDAREYHDRVVPGRPEDAVAAALGAVFDLGGPGQVRLVVEISAVAAGTGSLLATETRVAAMDAGSRRAFRAYWFAVGPFSALIRRRWLASAERALR